MELTSTTSKSFSTHANTSKFSWRLTARLLPSGGWICLHCQGYPVSEVKLKPCGTHFSLLMSANENKAVTSTAPEELLQSNPAHLIPLHSLLSAPLGIGHSHTRKWASKSVARMLPSNSAARMLPSNSAARTSLQARWRDRPGGVIEAFTFPVGEFCSA